MQMNLHDAKAKLSRYVEQALDGEEVVIARAGQPLVKLVPMSSTPRRRRLGFMCTKGIATADLKGDFADDINTMFG
jgi:prevent-host-death family protein